MTYYTSVIIIVWLALCVLAVLVYENARIPQREKIVMYLTYIIVALAALSEWLGVQINGNPNIPHWCLKFVKFWDYVLTPLAGGAIVFSFRSRTTWKKILMFVLLINTIFQVVASFTGWMDTINEMNQYVHGPLYPVYISFYVIIILIVLVEFALFGRKFTKRNMFSLFSIVFFVVAGILFQEIFGNQIRTAYLAITIGLSLLYIHYVEFSQLISDEKIQKQMVQIAIDPLTGIYSRYEYVATIEELDSKEQLPEDLVIFSIDINGLKNANDTKGHHAGDELICAAAQHITSVFAKYGKCYRIGGDEFVVIAHLDKEFISKLKNKFKHKVAEWHGKENLSLSVSIGSATAIQNPNVTVEKLIMLADQEMYKAKGDYYRNSGIERRQN